MKGKIQEEKKTGLLSIFGGLVVTLTVLIGSFFGLSIALAKAMQQKNFRDRIRKFNKQTLNPATLNIAGKKSRIYASIEHVGRKSGRMYKTPVVVRPFGDGFVIPLPYGSNVDWCRNIMAAGNCEMTWDEREYKLEKPEIVPLAKALYAYPLAQRIIFSVGGIKECLQLHKVPAVPVSMPAGDVKTGV